MSNDRIRQAIASRAAEVMYEGLEKEYFSAKRKAAKQIGIDYKYRPADLPSNREIRDQVLAFSRLYEGEARLDRLQDMRQSALVLMRKLQRFRPRLIGSVLTGHVRAGSDIDIHLFSDSLAAVTDALALEGIPYETEHKRVIKYGEARVFTHIHCHDKYEFELTLYPADKAHYVFKSSITGKAVERASIRELEELLGSETPVEGPDGEHDGAAGFPDAFEIFELLLEPLETVKQDRRHHPEGDALYHSLQVLELAREERPYDEEFLLAALLHDVGKAIDPQDHVGAALQALEGLVSERTEFLIAHHMEALAYRDGTLGRRARRRLESSEHFEDLMLLRELDRQGRQRGAQVLELSEALLLLQSLQSEEQAVRVTLVVPDVVP